MTFRRLTLGAILAAAMLTVLAPLSGAITAGQLDGNGHPDVAIIYFYQPDGRFRCSATQVSDTVLITAAHCTDGVRGKVLVNFDPVAPAAPVAADDKVDDEGTHTSQTGFTGSQGPWLAGTPHAHPLWADKLQLNNLHDVGVVVLDQPHPAAPYPPLAPRNYLATLANGRGGLSKQTFTVVGYGVFFVKPGDGPQKPTSVSDRTRRVGTAVGQNLTTQVLKLAENANDSRAGGGSCFGDSGGPVFHGGFLVADTSFGASQFCRSSGGYYRLDTDDARNFLDDYIAVP
jgi:hypothetical protein